MWIEKNEAANFIINKDNISIFSFMLKMFGTLSVNHNNDTMTIIDKIVGRASKTSCNRIVCTRPLQSGL
jgi:hypothetical protein